MLDPGKYFGQLTEAVTTEKDCKDGKNTIIVLSINLTHRLGTDGWIPLTFPEGRKAWLRWTDNAKKWTQKKLTALGFNGDFGAPRFFDDVTTKGTEWLCKHRTYIDDETKQERTTEDWDLLNWGDSVEQAPTDIIRRANAQWKQSQPKAAPAGKPTAPAPAPAPEPTPTPQPEPAAAFPAPGDDDPIPVRGDDDIDDAIPF